MSQQSPVTFTDLIAPLTPEEFFRDVWEQRPFIHRRAAGNDFSRLFGLEAVDQIIARTGLRSPAISLRRDGVSLPESSYTRDYRLPGGWTLRDVVDPAKILEEYHRGATIELPALELNWLPVARFRQHLEEALGYSTDAVAFLSPPNRDPQNVHQGLSVHYDTEDMFVLQISGTKRWRIYDAPHPLPLAQQSQKKTGVAPGDCLEEVTLAPGDAVYLPRGYFHEAITSSEHSLHLSVAVWTYRWLDALSTGLQLLGADVRFRRSVPGRMLTDGTFDEFAAEFEEIKNSALQQMSASHVAAVLRLSLLKSRHPVADGRLVDSVRLDEGADRTTGSQSGSPATGQPDGSNREAG